MKNLVKLLLIVSLFTLSLYAKDTTDVAGVFESNLEGTLNTAVEEAIAAGTLSNTVFKLTNYDAYVLTGPIKVPAGETLDLVGGTVGNDKYSGPPQIFWTTDGSVDNSFSIIVYGDLIMKNVWVRFADADGNQIGAPIVFDGDTLGTTGDTDEYGTFENCVFEYMNCPSASSGCICVRSENFNGVFKNCYFRNCIDPHYMYYGRAVSFPFDVNGYHTDNIEFENCTFANMGYVLMQEGTNYSDNISFNHCTFYNVMLYTLENGHWYNMNVNNCLFVNSRMLGYVPLSGEEGATVNITPVDSIAFTVPFTDQDRRILFTNSAYYMEDWLVDWMRGGWEKNYRGTEWRPDPNISSVGCEYSNGLYTERAFDEIPYPCPMLDSTSTVFFDSVGTDGEKLYPLINRQDLYDVSVAEDDEARSALNPAFSNPLVDETNEGALKYYLNEKWGTNLDTNWAYHPEAGFNQEWPLPENLNYTNETYLSAGMGGFPLGDLYHWWNPKLREGATDYYSAWKAQAEEEKATIAEWLETGTHPDVAIDGYKTENTSDRFTLSNNYPNPFNPTTNIRYNVPMKAKISLKVYDILGQEVAVLYEGYRDAGEYMATFDASHLASNVYFYQLKSGNTNITRKMILIK